jgi:hypothetical protein
MVNERLLDPSVAPSDQGMIEALGQPLAPAWEHLRRFMLETYDLQPLLRYGGKKYGWALQYKKGGRPLCEMYPEYGSFTTLVVLGGKELEQALARVEEFGALVRRALVETARFHDGCWMYMRVADPLTCEQDVQDIEQLVLIKKKSAKKKL